MQGIVYSVHMHTNSSFFYAKNEIVQLTLGLWPKININAPHHHHAVAIQWGLHNDNTPLSLSLFNATFSAHPAVSIKADPPLLQPSPLKPVLSPS